MTPILTGTISVDADSISVTGDGTNWATTVAPGDMLVVGLAIGFVASVASNTALTLITSWPGGDVVAGDYYITQLGAGNDTIETNRLLAEYAEALRAGTLFKPDASGTVAERADYDDEGKGFFYLDPSADPHQLYTKLSDTSGDWNSGTDWPRSGEDGISPTIDWDLSGVDHLDFDPGSHIKFEHANQVDFNDGKIGAGILEEGLNIVGSQTVAGGGRKTRLWGDLFLRNGKLNMAQGNHIKFEHANQVDFNDGKIGAGILEEGLNIVGSQTVAGGGRKTRLWGDLVLRNGQLNITNQPACVVSRNTGWEIWNPNEEFGIEGFVMNQGGFYLGSAINSGQRALHIPHIGLYLYMIEMYADAGANSRIYVVKNGNTSDHLTFATGHTSSASGHQKFTGIGVRHMAAGDYVSLSSGGFFTNAFHTKDHSQLTIIKIG